MSPERRKTTIPVAVGNVVIGGGAPVVIQSMTNTDTADAHATAEQIIQLAEAGSELVRFTVNSPEAAAATPEIAERVRDAGYATPLIGDFHYNGHRLLREFPAAAQALDKYRINPGNVGGSRTRDEHFAAICAAAVEHGKAVRIGVNAGSLNPDLVQEQMRINAEKGLGKSSEEVLNDCMVLSALRSVEMALANGLGEDRIIVSCKSSSPRHLVAVHRRLADQTRQPLHIGLTEAGVGLRGVVWSAAALGILLENGIGDTIRVSLTPRPGGDRREEVYAACEVLQALGLRSFAPSITSCPGCGRTTSSVFQALAEETQEYVRAKMPEWRRRYPGVEGLRLAVMGCIVNGPGESQAADIGISLPGTGEAPHCPVYVDGRKAATLSGTPEEVGAAFREMIGQYVARRFAAKPSE